MSGTGASGTPHGAGRADGGVDGREDCGVDGGGRSAGFTLIELLIVMIIVAVLAGMAIPVFLNQRGKAVDTDLKGDVRNVAAALETHYAGAQQYVEPSQSDRTVSVGADDVTVSEGTTVTVTALSSPTAVAAYWTSATGYCITATNPRGKAAGGVKFNSLDGGLTSTTCPS
jgi:type IV pilus assembly protein PilA